jgi:predicted 3-demethylubiquinone-9 3-methyltransferase (glyoxalase superfamily)
MGLNGGPQFRFNEAMSLVVNCETQKEVDFYWNKLTDSGEEGPCGWLKDKYGVSWQIVPIELVKMLTHPDKKKTQRVTKSFLQMKKLDIEVLKQVFNGQ